MPKLDDVEEMIQLYIGEEAYVRHCSLLKKWLRKRSEEDLFFLHYRVLGLAEYLEEGNGKDLNKQWLYDRHRDVEKEPDGYLDLWARGHFKSSIITFAKTIQDILIDQNIVIGIFSFKKTIAEAFLAQIKYQFEANEDLHFMYPEIFWENPSKAPSWSVQNGIRVQRTSPIKENTIEAHGVIEGMATSKHFDLMIYDDVVTADAVTTVEQIKKLQERFSISVNLGSVGGRMRIIGTRYHFNDLYGWLIEKGAVKVRTFPATDDGTVTGNPVFEPEAYLAMKRRTMTPYAYSCQMLQNPKADDVLGFERDWLRFWDVPTVLARFNYYILVDPASEKGKRNDFTVMLVVGAGEDGNYYVCDMIRKRMNLQEKAETLIELHKKYKPLKVGYEKYGMQSDIDGIKLIQGIVKYNFNIEPLAGNMAKNDRIRRLTPYFQSGLIYIPRAFNMPDGQGGFENLTEYFVEMEYIPFPFADKDDMLDCLSRICDEKMNIQFPKEYSVLMENKAFRYPSKRLLNQRSYGRLSSLKGRALSY
jgi:predicted phage terminase large subunit-like protein